MKTKKDLIVFIGDSITDTGFNRKTWHLKAKIAYPLQVAKTLQQYKYKFKGIASNRSYHVYDRLTKDCIRYNPKIVVLLIGVNDAWQKYVPDQYPPLTRPFEEHFSEIMRRFKAELENSKIIVMTPFLISTIEEKMPFKAFMLPYINYIRGQCQKYNYSIIDLQEVFDDAEKEYPPMLLSVDGVHPTMLGHSFIAKNVIQMIGMLN